MKMPTFLMMAGLLAVPFATPTLAQQQIANASAYKFGGKSRLGECVSHLAGTFADAGYLQSVLLGTENTQSRRLIQIRTAGRN